MRGAHGDSVWSVAWHGKSNRVVTGGIDGSLACWSGETLERVGELEGHALGVNCIDVCEAAPIAVTSSLDHVSEDTILCYST